MQAKPIADIEEIQVNLLPNLEYEAIMSILTNPSVRDIVRSEEFWELSLDNEIERVKRSGVAIEPLRTGRFDMGRTTQKNWQHMKKSPPPS